MNSLKDQALIECFVAAIDLRLDKDFIEMLLAEIRRRNIESCVSPVHMEMVAS